MRRGDPPSTATAARDEYERHFRLGAARLGRWEELRLDDLEFGRYSVEHRPSGRRFKVVRGLLDGNYSPAVAFARSPDGDVIALEELR